MHTSSVPRTLQPRPASAVDRSGVSTFNSNGYASLSNPATPVRYAAALLPPNKLEFVFFFLLMFHVVVQPFCLTYAERRSASTCRLPIWRTASLSGSPLSRQRISGAPRANSPTPTRGSRKGSCCSFHFRILARLSPKRSHVKRRWHVLCRAEEKPSDSPATGTQRSVPATTNPSTKKVGAVAEENSFVVPLLVAWLPTSFATFKLSLRLVASRGYVPSFVFCRGIFISLCHAVVHAHRFVTARDLAARRARLQRRAGRRNQREIWGRRGHHRHQRARYVEFFFRFEKGVESRKSLHWQLRICTRQVCVSFTGPPTPQLRPLRGGCPGTWWAWPWATRAKGATPPDRWNAPTQRSRRPATPFPGKVWNDPNPTRYLSIVSLAVRPVLCVSFLRSK